MEAESPTSAYGLAKFSRMLGLVVAALAGLPAFIGWLARPVGTTYLPFHMSLDDHMVYAAWMRQAMEGSFFFDNRFTTLEAQPGLTVNLYFFALGLLAKVFGIVLTLTLVRVVLSYVFVVVLGWFVALLGLEERIAKLAVFLSVFGGGLAWVSWQTFGDQLKSGPAWFSELLSGMQPIDNWQPEGFVFPSMLTNGLFLFAGCLFLVTLISILKCRDSWRPVLPGAVAFFLLMNTHSYDVLLVALLLIAFLVACAFNKTVTKDWVMRAGVVCLAAVPPALWFMHVLRQDTVFQSRAATPTFSPDPIQIAIALLPLFLLGVAAMASAIPARSPAKWGIGLLVAASFFGAIFPNFGAAPPVPTSVWICGFLLFVVASSLISKESSSTGLVVSWACVSLIAPYFPALFQRKLTMLIAVPWAILAAIGIATIAQHIKNPVRALTQPLLIVVCCLSSVYWLQRDITLAQSGVSRTLFHNLYLTRDETDIVNILDREGYGKGVLCMPGIKHPQDGSPAYLSDLNPTISGLTGAYTFAGHWSETPDYIVRRDIATKFFITPNSTASRIRDLQQLNVAYVVAPLQIAYEGLPLQDLSEIGETIYVGKQMRLIRVYKP